MDPIATENSYAVSRDKYAARGIDTESALSRLQAISLSLH
jgi:L-rhamnose isomerase